MFPVKNNGPAPHRMLWGAVCALAFGLMLWAGMAAAADRAPYGRIPAKRWNEMQLEQSTGGKALEQREHFRAAERERRGFAVHSLLGSHLVSRKSQALLRARGLGPALLAAGQPGFADKQAQDYQDTLRILIVRISFATNRDSSLTTIAPDGNFVLAPLANPGPLEIDPPPHNKAFYEAHLQGLSEYYDYQSGGRLHIEGRVLPEDPDGSYQVSDVADYGPGTGGLWTLEDLERLVQDMIVAADQGTQADHAANLADYDDDNPFTYIIFVHAGSDWQSDINGDSPNDIPTFFVTLGSPQPLTSSDSGTSATGMLSECSIIPETASQDGYPGSIAAAFYHEFGHALGLVDVYNTEAQTPNAGIWDLMDSGTNLGVTIGSVSAEGDTTFIVANGVLPPSLGAWNKWFLGWLDVGEIQGQKQQYRLPAVEVPRSQYGTYNGTTGYFSDRDHQALRAGISSREWFLLENRWVPSGPDETPYFNLSFERDENTGVILYLAGERPVGFWKNSGLYDYFMPAGGVLVWHVNEDRIEQGLADNTINTQSDGLRLVEADGITDIGILDSYVLGWYGSVRDPFGGYDSAGYTTDYNNLFTTGFPSSRAIDRSWTGFFLTDVVPNSRDKPSVMRFKAGIAPLVEGYPWTMDPAGQGVPRALAAESLTPLVAADDRSILIFASGPAAGDSTLAPEFLFALNATGNPVWPALPGGPPGAFATLPGPLAGPPVIAAIGAAGTGLVWSTRSGEVGLMDVSSQAHAVWSRKLGATFMTGAVTLLHTGLDPVVFALVGGDTMTALDLGDGTTVAPPVALGQGPVTGPPVVASDPAGDQVLAPGAAGWYEIAGPSLTGEMALTYHPYPAREASAGVRCVVVDSETGSRVWFLDGQGDLGGWQRQNGQWLPGDPLGLDAGIVCEPAVADLDGDGRNDLLVADGRRIHAFAATGARLRGWPVTLGELFPLADTTRIRGPLVVADGTGDGIDDVYFQTSGGHLLGVDATGSLLPGFPFRWAGKRAAGFAVGLGATPTSPRVLWLGSEGGYSGPPLERNLVNGRVTGFLLSAPAASGRTSEWLGARGGVGRNGPVGTAASLGVEAPVAFETDKAVLYPNPLGDAPLTVRFFSQDTRPARFWVHNLDGEIVYKTEIPSLAKTINEQAVALPQLVSGLYVCRLEFSSTAGRTMRTMTLAVER